MEVTIKPMNNCSVATVNGRIDSYTAPQLLGILNQVTNQNIYRIILDLTDVTYVSSAGLRVLIDIQKKCKQDNQGEVLLVNIPQRVYETLELVGFVPQFKFYNNVSSALAAFS
jgi:anti-sigma B factor antagonist